MPQASGQAAIDSRWWLVYADPTLNMLEDQAAKASPQLAAAVARVLQARAIARITDADLYPDVTFNPSASRSRQSGNRPIQPGFPVVPFVANDFRVLRITGEADNLWFLSLLGCREDLRKIARLRRGTLLSLDGVGSKYASVIQAWQRAAVFPEEALWVGPMIVADARRILALKREIKALDEVIEQ